LLEYVESVFFLFLRESERVACLFNYVCSKFVAVVVSVPWSRSLLLWLYPYHGRRENSPAQIVPNWPNGRCPRSEVLPNSTRPDLPSPPPRRRHNHLPPPLTSSACRALSTPSSLSNGSANPGTAAAAISQRRTAPENPRATWPAAGTHPST
jgi:hypothetical protein